jgi:ABC-type transport system involved in cytochrome bd biosynthesis fused ATPase/permease subunit
MKLGFNMGYVTEETAQSIIIIITIIIIIIIIITNTITTTIQASACRKWHILLSQRASIHATEEAFWGKSTNLDVLNNFRAAMTGMVEVNNRECRR